MDTLCRLHGTDVTTTFGCARATTYLRKWFKKAAAACACEVGDYCPHLPDPAMPFANELEAWLVYNQQRGYTL